MVADWAQSPVGLHSIWFETPRYPLIARMASINADLGIEIDPSAPSTATRWIESKRRFVASNAEVFQTESGCPPKMLLSDFSYSSASHGFRPSAAISGPAP